MPGDQRLLEEQIFRGNGVMPQRESNIESM
jgi:hypothetical protein